MNDAFYLVVGIFRSRFSMKFPFRILQYTTIQTNIVSIHIFLFFSIFHERCHFSPKLTEPFDYLFLPLYYSSFSYNYKVIVFFFVRSAQLKWFMENCLYIYGTVYFNVYNNCDGHNRSWNIFYYNFILWTWNCCYHANDYVEILKKFSNHANPIENFIIEYDVFSDTQTNVNTQKDGGFIIQTKYIYFERILG